MAMTQTSVLSLDEHIDELERVTRATRIIRLLCLGVVIVCIAIAGGLLLPRINQQREELELVVKDFKFKEIPPSVSLPSPMLATFRGVLIHFLWPRAEELKQEGKYYELQQLSDWMCNLQPRFPKAWEYAAWNMAYNISVGTYSSRERWHWVYAGVLLIRDRGLVYNPRTINLYKEISWIYLHKVGDYLDDHHWAYKRNWGCIMERVLGQPPPEAQTQEVIDAFRQIADAGIEMGRYGTAVNPEALGIYIRHDDKKPSMGDFVERLKELHLNPDADFLEKVARYDREGLQEADLVLQSGDAHDHNFLASFKELMADKQLAPARDRLLAAVRAHVLTAEHKLDVQFMFELMEKYGPLDWRTPFSHGLYWAALGSQECFGSIGINENVEMNTDRFIQFGLKDSWERGRLVFNPDFDDPFKSYIQLLPDLRFIDYVHKVYLEHAQKHVEEGREERYFQEGPAGRLFRSGHINFLHGAIRSLYFEGYIQQSRKYYEYCRENYTQGDGSPQEQYLVPLEEFALSSFLEDMGSFRRGPLVLDSMMQSSFLYLACDRPQTAVQRFTIVRKGYDKFMEGKELDRVDRRKIPPWPNFVSSSFQRFVLSYPLPLYMRARAWKAIDNDVKLHIYRQVEEPLNSFCEKNDPPLDMDKAFPPPEGLEEYERSLTQPDSVKKELKPGEEADFKDAETSEGHKR